MGVRGMAKWGLATVLLLEVVGSGIADLSAGAASHERSQGDKALMEGKLPLALKHYEAAVRIPFPAITCQALSWEMFGPVDLHDKCIRRAKVVVEVCAWLLKELYTCLPGTARIASRGLGCVVSDGIRHCWVEWESRN